MEFNRAPVSDYSNSPISNSESIPSWPPNLSTNLLHDSESTSTSCSASSSSTSEGGSPDMGDSSNSVLKFISEMLMEEDLEGKTCMSEDSLALQAAEKSFYDVIGQKYPPSPIRYPFSGSYQNVHNLFDRIPQRLGVSNDFRNWYRSKGTLAANSDGVYFQSGYESSEVHKSFFEPQVCTRSVPYSFSDLQSVGNFRGGTGESSSVIIPSIKFGTFDMERNPISMPAGHGEIVKSVVDMPEKEANHLPIRSRSKRNHQLEHGGDSLEGRENKHSAVYADDYSDLQEMFDKVLLNHGDEDESNALRGFAHVEGNWKLQHSEQAKGSGKKTRSKKLQDNKKEEMVDLWTLLIQCAQAAASFDQKTATKLLKQIREHSSVEGDATQRVAHYFADGLEARLEGIMTPSYSPHVSNYVSASEILKAYHLFVTACPFKRMSNFFANRTILKLAQKATRIHIIDFGILYGFQWPCLIQHLSERPGGPPKLRITGIELPQPGFRPSVRAEGAVRRLENYCKRFNVPVEFKVIAQKWETIRVEDLNIHRDEFTAVNCLNRLKHLPDETVMPNNPRDTVLKLIRSMNPDVFITGVINGTFNSPFFITRFKEALFYYFTLFDMLDASVPRENKPRMNFEKAIYGKEIMNVIGCEGAERVVRPETYKKWQARITNAGFKQMTPNQDIVEKIKSMVKLGYHKDFVVAEQGRWLLQGWKGRISFGLTSWKPA